MTNNNVPRTPTNIDRIAERWVDTLCELVPETQTWLGRENPSPEYSDYTVEGTETYIQAAKTVLYELSKETPTDVTDQATHTDLTKSLHLDIKNFEQNTHLNDLNTIHSPLQSIQSIFDLMPTNTTEDWANIDARLTNLPKAVKQYIKTLNEGIRQNITPALRQVVEAAKQAKHYSEKDGPFTLLAAQPQKTGTPLPGSLQKNLNQHADEARKAYAILANYLVDILAPHAQQKDAVGRDAYTLASEGFLGKTVDLDETYLWGLNELENIRNQQANIISQILPGATVKETIKYLDEQEHLTLHGTDKLQAWMQNLSDTAVKELGKTHFNIQHPLNLLDCRIAPSNTGGIYYTGPSDDFTRPGQMWWSVPETVTTFHTWKETSTVYHEGVPGHHLQIATAVGQKDNLNTWRRQLAGTSGHAEGWALYAEQLMNELGYLTTPEEQLGMLNMQQLRAARVVLDIGVHLEKQTPTGDGVWTAEYAHQFLTDNYHDTAESIRYEWLRYLGWPGQAPSYKIGQRIWNDLRATASQQSGFDLKTFHQSALELGGLRLDTLEQIVGR